MMAKLKFMAPLFMAGMAATAIAAAPYAVADAYAVAAGSSITHFAPEDPGGSGCTADGRCGHGGPGGGGGCVPGVGCFNWGQ
jgi:hypothetical protein